MDSRNRSGEARWGLVGTDTRGHLHLAQQNPATQAWTVIPSFHPQFATVFPTQSAAEAAVPCVQAVVPMVRWVTVRLGNYGEPIAARWETYPVRELAQRTA